MQLTIMILGSSGPIGRFVSGSLIAMGHRTVGVSRTGKVNNDSRHIKADRGDTEELARIVDLTQPNIVIDMRSMSARDTLPVVNALENRRLRYVMISSADVYRNYGQLIGAEGGQFDGAPITEDSPLRTTLYPYRAVAEKLDDPKADWRFYYDKIPAENCVASAMDDFCILRLPMIFGKGKALARFSWILEPIKRGEDTVFVPEGWLEWVATYGYVKNVGAAIAHCSLHPAATGETINISDIPAADHAVWADDIRKATGWLGNIIVDDEKAGRLAEVTSGLNRDIPLVVDGGKLRGKFGFEPPFGRLASISDHIDF